MAEDWASDVRLYAPDADAGVIAGIVRYCGIALRSPDASLVSFSDPAETGRVRDNFLKKKLGLVDSDSDLDAAIAKVGERMGADRTRNRVTVYYLLAEAFGKLDLFGAAKAPDPVMTAPVVPQPMMAPPVMPPPVMAPPVTPPPVMPPPVMAPVPPPVVVAAPVAVAGTVRRAPVAGLGWAQYLPLAVLIVGGAGILYWVTAPRAVLAPAAAVVVAEVPAPIAAVQLPAMLVPDGAGLVREEVAGKPLISVYFDTAKTDLHPDVAPAVAEMKAYLDANPGSSLAVSGYSDPRGNAAFNAELSKNRAFAVRDALIAAGVPEAAIDLQKPVDSTDASGSLANGRRVDVRVI